MEKKFIKTHSAILKKIESSFQGRISIHEKRPGIYQVELPYYHEDGDMIDLFIVPKENNQVELCDFGMTLMRLSYSYEIDTPNKESILQKILKENRLEEVDGNIKFLSKEESIFSDILHTVQSYSKIGSMRYFKREVIENLFYENLDEIIETDFLEYSPKKGIIPIADRDDLPVDYEFRWNGQPPIYLFAVKDNSKARLSALSCLEYQKAYLKFHSLIVFEDLSKISKNDISRVLNVSDNNFTSLEEFRAGGKSFLARQKEIFSSRMKD